MHLYLLVGACVLLFGFFWDCDVQSAEMGATNCLCNRILMLLLLYNSIEGNKSVIRCPTSTFCKLIGYNCYIWQQNVQVTDVHLPPSFHQIVIMYSMRESFGIGILGGAASPISPCKRFSAFLYFILLWQRFKVACTFL